MRFSIITLFPEIFPPVLNFSILGRAQKKGKVSFEIVDLRKFGLGSQKRVDDKPYGGGVGMIIKPDVLAHAVRSIVGKSKKVQNYTKFKIVLMSASGKTFNQKKARQLSELNHLIIVCGHYEGVDQRFVEKFVDEEISIGDYILTGGEIPAMVIIDSITRLIPGVLDKPEAILNESFSNPLHMTHYPSLLLEYPQYTRPETFEEERVPEVLLSGNHQEIRKWREEKSLEKTKKLRPDLLS